MRWLSRYLAGKLKKRGGGAVGFLAEDFRFVVVPPVQHKLVAYIQAFAGLVHGCLLRVNFASPRTLCKSRVESLGDGVYIGIELRASIHKNGSKSDASIFVKLDT